MDSLQLIKNSYERYSKNQNTEGVELLEEQILELLDTQMKQVVLSWLEVYGKNPNLPLSKKLEALYDKSIIDIIKELEVSL